MIVAGPCLLNDDQKEIDNFYQTAIELEAIDPSIVYRCKVIGGGTRPDRWADGLRRFNVFEDVNLATATEIHTLPQAYNALNDGVDILWIGARNAQNYTLLMEIAEMSKANDTPIIVKRHPGMGIKETWGLHDCYKERGVKNIYICERGINTFNRTEDIRWSPDFQFMAQTIGDRPDIKLMFDLSHSSFNKSLLFKYAMASKAMGVKHFMVECYADTTATISDKAHALNMDEFKELYDIIS